MTERGIDQVLPRPCAPHLHEPSIDSALEYLQLAEQRSGAIRPLAPADIWGVAREELARIGPDARIVNLETSMTRSETPAPKGINYCMSPENAGCLAAGGIDCCVLANNHVLDWGRAGLLDTLATLQELGIKAAGAGRRRGTSFDPRQRTHSPVALYQICGTAVRLRWTQRCRARIA
jgi:poly-gamma-glutamate synthesis protein (capsule biosynthesis protein)